MPAFQLVIHHVRRMMNAARFGRLNEADHHGRVATERPTRMRIRHKGQVKMLSDRAAQQL